MKKYYYICILEGAEVDLKAAETVFKSSTSTKIKKIIKTDRLVYQLTSSELIHAGVSDNEAFEYIDEKIKFIADKLIDRLNASMHIICEFYKPIKYNNIVCFSDDDKEIGGNYVLHLEDCRNYPTPDDDKVQLINSVFNLCKKDENVEFVIELFLKWRLSWTMLYTVYERIKDDCHKTKSKISDLISKKELKDFCKAANNRIVVDEGPRHGKISPTIHEKPLINLYEGHIIIKKLLLNWLMENKLKGCHEGVLV